jgi:hypothetical protein
MQDTDTDNGKQQHNKYSDIYGTHEQRCSHIKNDSAGRMATQVISKFSPITIFVEPFFRKDHCNTQGKFLHAQ